MTEFTTHPIGAPCWVDLMSPDVDAAKTFYSTVFGWDAEDSLDDDGNRIYVMFTLDGKSVAGLGAQPPTMAGMPPVWNSYIAVDDCAKTAEAATAAGGSVIMPPMQVMGAGEMAVIADPTGAAISLWKAGQHRGAQVCNEPNTWSWNELMSRDINSAKAFYSEVFGWTYDEIDMGPGGIYNVISGGETGRGGLMATPDEVPAEVPDYWGVYFMVADADASAAAVNSAGGEVMMEPFDVEGVGRMAMVTDSSGGNFALMQAEAS